MNKLLLYSCLFIGLLTSLIVAVRPNVFAADPIQTSIIGRVWVDSNGSGALDPQEATLAAMPIFIQLVDQSDFAMTLVVYSNEIGGFAAEGLPPGTYQIWTENESEGVFLQIVTLSESTPTATANLPIIGHRVFMPMVIQQ